MVARGAKSKVENSIKPQVRTNDEYERTSSELDSALLLLVEGAGKASSAHEDMAQQVRGPL